MDKRIKSETLNAINAESGSYKRFSLATILALLPTYLHHRLVEQQAADAPPNESSLIVLIVSFVLIYFTIKALLLRLPQDSKWRYFL